MISEIKDSWLTWENEMAIITRKQTLNEHLHSELCNINDHSVVSTLICQVKPLHQNFLCKKNFCKTSSASVLQRPAVFLSWAQCNCDWIFAVQEMNISLKLCSSWRSRNYTVKLCDCTQQTGLTTRYKHTHCSHSSSRSYSSSWSHYLSVKYLFYLKT